MTPMSSAVDRRPLVPGHAIGTMNCGPVRRVWCSCGWRWLQLDPAMDLNDARRMERERISAHRALAAPPLPPEESHSW